MLPLDLRAPNVVMDMALVAPLDAMSDSSDHVLNASGCLQASDPIELHRLVELPPVPNFLQFPHKTYCHQYLG